MLISLEDLIESRCTLVYRLALAASDMMIKKEWKTTVQEFVEAEVNILRKDLTEAIERRVAIFDPIPIRGRPPYAPPFSFNLNDRASALVTKTGLDKIGYAAAQKLSAGIEFWQLCQWIGGHLFMGGPQILEYNRIEVYPFRMQDDELSEATREYMLQTLEWLRGNCDRPAPIEEPEARRAWSKLLNQIRRM